MPRAEQDLFIHRAIRFMDALSNACVYTTPLFVAVVVYVAF